VNILMDWYAKEVAHRTRSTLDETIYPMLRKGVNIFIYAIVFIIVLDHFNIEISPLIASLGVASLAVALALQDTLSNFFSGMYMIADRPIKVGDFVEIEGGESGFVEKIGWRSTWIKKLGNNILVIPNSKLANSTIINYSMPMKPVSLVVTCGVSYDSDLRAVEKTAYDVAKKTIEKSEHAYKDFEPLIRFYNFGDSNVDFKVIVRANTYVDRFALAHELIKNLHTEFAKKGIEINYPTRNLYFKNELEENTGK